MTQLIFLSTLQQREHFCMDEMSFASTTEWLCTIAATRDALLNFFYRSCRYHSIALTFV